jgi:hypothetical protein
MAQKQLWENDITRKSKKGLSQRRKDRQESDENNNVLACSNFLGDLCEISFGFQQEHTP